MLFKVCRLVNGENRPIPDRWEQPSKVNKQAEMMAQLGLEWITSPRWQNSCTPVDVERAEQAIDRLYALWDRDPPAIVWCRSFYQLATMPSLLFAVFHSDAWHFVCSELSAANSQTLTERQWDESWNELFPNLWLSTGAQTLRQMYRTSRAARECAYLEENLLAQIKPTLSANLRNGRLQRLQQMLKREIYRKIWYTELRQDFVKNSFVQLRQGALERIDLILDRGTHSAARQEPPDETELLLLRGRAITHVFHALAQRLGGEAALQASRVLWLSDSVSWLSATDRLLADHVVSFNEIAEPSVLWSAVARTASAVLCFEGITFLCEIPTACYINESLRLHNGSGAALTYSDGFAQYAWQGTFVPRHVVEHPESISVSEIETETNAEVRRVMIERYGEARFLQDAHVVPVQQDEFGTLYRKEFANDEPLVMVRVLNSTPEPDGTTKYYYLRVPPHITSAHDAVAWTFEFDSAEDYNPGIQT